MCFSMISQSGVVFANEDKINVANIYGKATASNVEVDYYGTDKLIDGIVNRDASNKKDQSRWSSGKGAPQWAMINLQRICSFDEINIYWENAKVQQFHIEISDDGTNWTTLYTSESLEGGHPQDTKIDIGHRVYTQYVKVTVDKLISGAYPSVSIYEVELMGDKTENESGNLMRVNYALNATATAKTSPISYWGPDKMVDGIINRDASKADQSRWSSEANAPQWVMIDLGETKSFDEIQIAWEKAWIKDFHIEASQNGTDFDTVYKAET
ncbi:MAG: discoidin domain-containing protein, partial [Faecalibacillus sp.]